MAICKNAEFTMVGTGPLLFGKAVFEEKRDDESHAQFDERTWQQKCTTDNDGRLAISGTAVHRCLVAGGSWLKMKFKGTATFGKRFESGVFPVEPFFPIEVNGYSATTGDTEGSRVYATCTPEHCEKYPLFVPVGGDKRGTSRVWRIFPRLKPGWRCRASILVTDEQITAKVFEKHIRAAGLHDGMGAMRIGRGGPNGMFTVEEFKMTDAEF